MKTLIATPDPDHGLTKEDALEYLGPDGRKIFGMGQRNDRRIGQSWMNALPYEDYEKLTGTLWDPFYRDDWDSVVNALAYLLAN